MLPAIHLDDDAPFDADEVHDVTAVAVLAAKLVTA